MYERALREVGEVLDNMDSKYTSKISSDFFNMLIKKSDWSYQFKYDKRKSIMEQNLSDEAKILLSIIYLRYFVSKEEKWELIQLMKKNEEKEEVLKNKKYDVNNVFGNSDNKKNEIKNNIIVNQNYNLKQINEKWYKKIVYRIRLYFQKFK